MPATPRRDDPTARARSLLHAAGHNRGGLSPHPAGVAAWCSCGRFHQVYDDAATARAELAAHLRRAARRLVRESWAAGPIRGRAHRDRDGRLYGN